MPHGVPGSLTVRKVILNKRGADADHLREPQWGTPGKASAAHTRYENVTAPSRRLQMRRASAVLATPVSMSGAFWFCESDVQRTDASPTQAPQASNDIQTEGGAAVQVKASNASGENADVRAVAAEGVKGSGQTLPHLDQIQASFGSHDVTAARAHVGGKAAEAADVIGAHAYATGNDIAFAKSPDLHTAAHEAAHVVQQRAGVHLKGGVGQAGDQYEQNADAVADRVVAGQSAEDLLVGDASG